MSTYSTNLALELIADGDQTGTWGTTTNTNLGTLIEQAISGYVTQACTGGTDTITIPNGATGVARNMFLELTGTGGGTLVVPSNKKLYFIYNNTSSAITVKVSGQTGVSVPAAAKMVLVSNGTDIVTATNYLASLTLGSPLGVASGGSGVASNTAYAVLTGGTTSTGAVQSVASVGTSGQVLTSNGAGALPSFQTITSFVSGMIMLWSGSSASIPSGWVICDGTNSTPDLRNRFVVGAGSTYAVGATGGSANATLVSHTHTATDSGHTHTSTIKSTKKSGGDTPDILSAGENLSGDKTITSNTGTANITVSTEGSSATNANLPPYYALCYIMKT
jgi:microcystin-dependent protein